MNTVVCGYCGKEYLQTYRSCPACGMETAVPEQTPEHTLPIGTVLQGGKFSVGRVLGEGGFGITYKGAHRYLKRQVAIKELFPDGAVRTGNHVTVADSRQAEFKGAIESILQEAQVVASLDSSYIVDVHDVLMENGTVYMVMEYLTGQTLQERIDELGRLPLDEVQQLALDMCDALVQVHQHGLIHRDIKPENVMLTEDGRTVLIDFGSAREYQLNQTRRLTRILTRLYAAPEQYSARARFGPTTDIFCLGATLFHALTGTLPTEAMARLQSPQQVIQFPAGLQGPLCTAIAKALNLRVEDRPQTMQEFKSFLEKDKKITKGTSIPSVKVGTGDITPNSSNQAIGKSSNLASHIGPKDPKAGEIREGIVSGMNRHGVFVDLKGTAGRIPIGELSWSWVNDPKEILSVGQRVRVKVLPQNSLDKYIKLSLRQLQTEPWDNVADRYKVGDMVYVVITAIKSFGAFAQLLRGEVVGLIYISELSYQHVAEVADIVAVGEEHLVKIISIDTVRYRMGLSIKQVDLD